MPILFLFGDSYLNIVILETEVFFDNSLNFHFAVRASLDCEGDIDRLSILLLHNFSMVLKYLIEIWKGEISVELLNLRVRFGVRVAFVPHRIVILRRVLQRIQIIVLNVTST